MSQSPTPPTVIQKIHMFLLGNRPDAYHNLTEEHISVTCMVEDEVSLPGVRLDYNLVKNGHSYSKELFVLLKILKQRGKKFRKQKRRYIPAYNNTNFYVKCRGDCWEATAQKEQRTPRVKIQINNDKLYKLENDDE